MGPPAPPTGRDHLKHSRKLVLIFMALAAIVGMVAVACGDDDDNTAATATKPAGGATTAASPTTAAAPTFAADSTMAKIVANKKMVVGVKFDQPGFGLKDPVSGKVDGFDVAIAKEIGKALGLKEE